MLHEASQIETEINRTNINRFAAKSFFCITHLLVKENWAHTHNFKNVVELIAECGQKQFQTHFLTASKNAKYTLPVYAAK